MKTTLPALALLCLPLTLLKSQTWTALGTVIFLPGSAIYGISVPSDSVVWAIASNYNVASSESREPVLQDLDLRSFPSPFSETLEVQVVFEHAASGSMEVYDLSGCLVFSEKMEGQAVWNKRIGTQSWAAGPYFLPIRTVGASLFVKY